MLPSTICAPTASTSAGISVFTVAFVPTGMNAGVWTSPCAVRSTPARAAPAVAVTEKLMAQASRVGDSSRVTTVQPAGTVTLVFTDVEGSTRLLDSLGPEEYRRALGEHREAVRAAFERHGGYEVDTAGDGFFYAFSTATGAALAVRDTLETLEGGPVRIRVGVHTGEPILDPPKYVGLDVHRAARIMAAGARRTGAALPDDPRPARRPLRASATSASTASRTSPRRSGSSSSGAAEFPRPRTLHQTNLPVPATEFLGREREARGGRRRLRTASVCSP